MTCPGKFVWRWKLGVLSRLEVCCSRWERLSKGCFHEKSGLAEKWVNLPSALPAGQGACALRSQRSLSEAVLRWFYHFFALCGEWKNQRCPWDLKGEPSSLKPCVSAWCWWVGCEGWWDGAVALFEVVVQGDVTHAPAETSLGLWECSRPGWHQTRCCSSPRIQKS